MALAAIMGKTLDKFAERFDVHADHITSWRTQLLEGEEAGLKQRIKAICETRVRYGYRRMHVLPIREGWTIHEENTQALQRVGASAADQGGG